MHCPKSFLSSSPTSFLRIWFFCFPITHKCSQIFKENSTPPNQVLWRNCQVCQWKLGTSWMGQGVQRHCLDEKPGPGLCPACSFSVPSPPNPGQTAGSSALISWHAVLNCRVTYTHNSRTLICWTVIYTVTPWAAFRQRARCVKSGFNDRTSVAAGIEYRAPVKYYCAPGKTRTGTAFSVTFFVPFLKMQKLKAMKYCVETPSHKVQSKQPRVVLLHSNHWIEQPKVNSF